MKHLGVSTRGDENQPLACPGVRAHRGPGVLGSGAPYVMSLMLLLLGLMHTCIWNIVWVEGCSNIVTSMTCRGIGITSCFPKQFVRKLRHLPALHGEIMW